MREIEFRGKSPTGNWIYGYYFGVLPNLNIPTIVSIQDGKNYTVNSKTIGQYTGLLDKNGTKIFFGDILATSNG
jgi:hypothetical protein